MPIAKIAAHETSIAARSIRTVWLVIAAPLRNSEVNAFVT